MEKTNIDSTEKIIDKIRKILELSKNNPSEEEAKAAALKAQKMMAEYHIEQADLDGVSDIEEIAESGYMTHKGGTWKFYLAHIIAKNFRCKTYSSGRRYIVFYGYETDTKIAKEVFEYLYNLGTSLATKEYNKYKAMYGTARGIMNSWYKGFLAGISSVLDKQCTALMIVVPKEVEDSYEDKTKDFKKTSHTISVSYNSNNDMARNSGYEAGKSAMQSKAIEGGD